MQRTFNGEPDVSWEQSDRLDRDAEREPRRNVRVATSYLKLAQLTRSLNLGRELVDDAPRKCTPGSHDATKSDPARWATLRYVGKQHTPADEYGPAETLELRDCSCGSTLSVTVQS